MLCEKSFSSDSFPVVVIELGETIKPRWFSHYQFSRKVRKWLAENPNKTRIVHSHERQSKSPCFYLSYYPVWSWSQKIFQVLKFKKLFYEELERRELMGHQVMAIVPVSNKLGDIILSKHIAVKKKLLNAIHPGVVAPIVNS